MRLAVIPCLLAASLVGQTALAGKDKEKADYGVLLGVSPFGGTANFSFNPNKKTSWNFAIGGSPEMTTSATIDDVEYEITGSSAWSGVFWNHRPIKSANWFRFVAGVGIGRITGELDDGNGGEFLAKYSENPVGYTGVGFGNRAVKGFTIGFDIGMLTTAGPDITNTGTGSADQLEAIEDNWRFGSVLPNAQLTVGWGF